MWWLIFREVAGNQGRNWGAWGPPSFLPLLLVSIGFHVGLIKALSCLRLSTEWISFSARKRALEARGSELQEIITFSMTASPTPRPQWGDSSLSTWGYNSCPICVWGLWMYKLSWAGLLPSCWYKVKRELTFVLYPSKTWPVSEPGRGIRMCASS